MSQCPDCGKSFSRSDNLKRHIKNVHEKMSPEMPVHHPKPMHHQDGSCITVALPKLIHPFTCLVAGPTGSGKTSFLKKLLELKHEKIYQCPQRIVWCYSQWQPLYTTMKNVEFQQGLPDVEELESCLLVLDDMMDSLDSRVADLFTKGSHHKNISVIAVMQNVFHQSRFQRTLSLNTHYMVLFKNPRDASQIQYLARQMYPKDPEYLVQVYERVMTLGPYSYLFIDFRQETPDNMRLRANILEDEERYYCQRK